MVIFYTTKIQNNLKQKNFAQNIAQFVLMYYFGGLKPAVMKDKKSDKAYWEKKMKAYTPNLWLNEVGTWVRSGLIDDSVMLYLCDIISFQNALCGFDRHALNRNNNE